MLTMKEVLIFKNRNRGDMTNSDGQLYTIEGFAAALIMIITAFLVVNATSVYTAGDTHISDMQLEALGTDALMTMSTPVNSTEDAMNHNTLQNILEICNSNMIYSGEFFAISQCQHNRSQK